jgi:hypothetical protein
MKTERGSPIQAVDKVCVATPVSNRNGWEACQSSRSWLLPWREGLVSRWGPLRLVALLHTHPTGWWRSIVCVGRRHRP